MAIIIYYVGTESAHNFKHKERETKRYQLITLFMHIMYATDMVQMFTISIVRYTK